MARPQKNPGTKARTWMKYAFCEYFDVMRPHEEWEDEAVEILTTCFNYEDVGAKIVAGRFLDDEVVVRELANKQEFGTTRPEMTRDFLDAFFFGGATDSSKPFGENIRCAENLGRSIGYFKDRSILEGPNGEDLGDRLAKAIENAKAFAKK